MVTYLARTKIYLERMTMKTRLKDNKLQLIYQTLINFLKDDKGGIKSEDKVVKICKEIISSSMYASRLLSACTDFMEKKKSWLAETADVTAVTAAFAGLLLSALTVNQSSAVSDIIQGLAISQIISSMVLFLRMTWQTYDMLWSKYRLIRRGKSFDKNANVGVSWIGSSESQIITKQEIGFAGIRRTTRERWHRRRLDKSNEGTRGRYKYYCYDKNVEPPPVLPTEENSCV